MALGICTYQTEIAATLRRNPPPINFKISGVEINFILGKNDLKKIC